MLSLTIFLPLITAAVVLLTPRSRPGTARWIALLGSIATLAVALALLSGMAGEGLWWQTQLAWIPPLNATYHVAVDGVSLPLVLLTAVLLVAVMVYVLPQRDRPHAHAGLFLLMATGLLGVFCAKDLLLFYLFFEIALVPMYFIIGLWGHGDRRYAAMKFFLYTRGGSLAMLLAFLGLYLAAEPHTFSLPALSAARPLADHPTAAGLVLLGLLIGFGVKLPTVPLHNWLPDAHVEAPTEGSVILAGLQLKMGAYGLIRVALPTVPTAIEAWSAWLIVLGVLSLLWGALAALAQSDLKRLIAYTSINHMGYVMLAAGLWPVAGPAVRQLAVNGAVYQMVSHGLLTGGMFFVAGMIQQRAGTREMGRLGGVMARAPVFAAIVAVLAFGSLGLPGLSGFIAEFQVIGAAVATEPWAAVLTVLALVITTGLYLRIVVVVLWGEPTNAVAPLGEPGGRELAVIAALAALSILLGVLPWLLMSVIEPASRALAETMPVSGLVTGSGG